MSLFDYKQSIELTSTDASFASLIMAAIRKADTINSMKLQTMYPEIWKELNRRYNSPGGILDEESEPTLNPGDEVIIVESGKVATVEALEGKKYKVSFDASWCGWYGRDELKFKRRGI